MYDYIKTVVPKEHIVFHEPMSKHTTFRVGGEAECFIMIQQEEELAQLIPYLNQIEKEYFILGNGSNLLVGDKGYRGIVMKFAGPMEDIRVEGTRITAKAGAMLTKVAVTAKENALSGLEFAAGIPGSIGGGVVMNAGAYDGEIKQVVEAVRVMDNEYPSIPLSGQGPPAPLTTIFCTIPFLSCLHSYLLLGSALYQTPPLPIFRTVEIVGFYFPAGRILVYF